MISKLFVMQVVKFTEFEGANSMNFGGCLRKVKNDDFRKHNGVNDKSDFFGLLGFIDP